MVTSQLRTARTAGLLFALALGVRLAYVLGTPDRAGPHTPFFKGDAPLWLAYANALREGVPFTLELDLPLRPPGTAYLLAWLWDGTAAGLPTARVIWALLGSILAPLVFLVGRRAGATAALVAGTWVALAGGEIQLASTFCAEVPYALCAVLAIGLTLRLTDGARLGAACALGVVHAVALLFRVEHLLLAGSLTAWLVWRRRASRMPRALCDVAAMLLVAGVTLLPWQLHVHTRIEEFNRSERPSRPPTALTWSDAAGARLDEVPGFARAATQRFVEATLRHRGQSRVGIGDLVVVEEAFGTWPKALPTWPLVALYGPLNFALANHAEADGGFDRRRLDQRPPLAGGEGAFDRNWLRSLPTGGDLALEYPPHLQLVREGYGLGLSFLVSHPLEGLELGLCKLWITWAGAVSGFGAGALPLGASGSRRRVDITVAAGVFAATWRIATLLLLGWAMWRARACRAYDPWALWLLATMAVAVAFFGYARSGAVATPAVGLAIGTLVQSAPRRAALRALGIAAVAIVILADLGRLISPPSVLVDGQPVGVVEPFAPLTHENRSIEVR